MVDNCRKISFLIFAYMNRKAEYFTSKTCHSPRRNNTKFAQLRGIPYEVKKPGQAPVWVVMAYPDVLFPPGKEQNTSYLFMNKAIVHVRYSIFEYDILNCETFTLGPEGYHARQRGSCQRTSFSQGICQPVGNNWYYPRCPCRCRNNRESSFGMDVTLLLISCIVL